jgi:uncharacterized membrane protein
MESKATFLGHPIHQMLIVFPLGLLATSLMFDIIQLATHDPEWSHVAFYLIGAGVIGGVAAALFGLIDFLGIPKSTRAKGIAKWHGLGNVIVVGLFGLSFFLRIPDPEAPSVAAFVLSVCGIIIALAAGWLGGELVTRFGIGVADGANPDAPS